ncbi:MAG: prepilin-type N-terminal cleavage/methylation domain-containing protein [bacterium]
MKTTSLHTNYDSHRAAPSPLLAGEDGFTLVELLVALTIFSIVGLAAFTLLQRTVFARAVTMRQAQELAETRHALSTLVTDLSNARAFSLSLFKGFPDTVGFAMLSDLADDASVLRHAMYFLQESPDHEFKQLVRATSDFHGHEVQTTLLPNVATMQLSYLRKQTKGTRWVDDWGRSTDLPLAVRVRLDLPARKAPLQIVCPIRSHEKISKK